MKSFQILLPSQGKVAVSIDLDTPNTENLGQKTHCPFALGCRTELEIPNWSKACDYVGMTLQQEIGLKADSEWQMLHAWHFQAFFLKLAILTQMSPSPHRLQLVLVFLTHSFCHWKSMPRLIRIYEKRCQFPSVFPHLNLSVLWNWKGLRKSTVYSI